MAQDHELQQAVLAELAWKPSMTAAHLTRTYAQSMTGRALPQRPWAAPGATDVINDVTVS